MFLLASEITSGEFKVLTVGPPMPLEEGGVSPSRGVSFQCGAMFLTKFVYSFMASSVVIFPSWCHASLPYQEVKVGLEV